MPVDVYDAAAWMSVTALSENRLQRAARRRRFLVSREGNG